MTDKNEIDRLIAENYSLKKELSERQLKLERDISVIGYALATGADHFMPMPVGAEKPTGILFYRDMTDERYDVLNPNPPPGVWETVIQPKKFRTCGQYLFEIPRAVQAPAGDRPSHANAPADSGTHPHNDGLDSYRGCCGSCPAGCVMK